MKGVRKGAKIAKMEMDYDSEKPENAGPTFSSYGPISKKCHNNLLGNESLYLIQSSFSIPCPKRRKIITASITVLFNITEGEGGVP